MRDPYQLPNGVMRNKLGITDAELLAVAEADITRARLIQLTEQRLPGTYDLAHLRAFHKAIFGDLYEWAGELRTVEISKHTPFCPLVNLVSYADEVFGRLRSADYLRGLPQPEFVHGLAELYGDINALHPSAKATEGCSERSWLSWAPMPVTCSRGPAWTLSATRKRPSRASWATTNRYSACSTA